MTLLPALAMWIILFVGGSEIVAGRMQVADFFTFAMYVYELTFPTFMHGLGGGAGAARRGLDAADRRAALRDARDRGSRRRRRRSRELRGEIEFRELTFRYPGSDRAPALRDVSLRVPAGTTLGVVGTVGSGKSTLACADPAPVRGRRRPALRRRRRHQPHPARARCARSIAMVPQDSFLFSMTLAENIAFGGPTVRSREQIARGRAARAAREGRAGPSRRLRHAGRRARRDALRAASASARRWRARCCCEPSDPDPRRHALERRRRDRGGDPARARGGLPRAHRGGGLVTA